MYYYKFNIGDYAKCTRHLSNLEDLAYRRLLELYYSDESPLTNDVKKLSRLIMMRENEQEVSNVLDDFFFLDDDQWKQNRVEKELDEYRAKAETARGNGKKGGRPKKPSNNPAGSKNNPGGFENKPDSNPEITGSKANHKPLTTNQEPLKEISPSGSSTEVDQQDLIGDLESYVKPESKNKMPRDWITKLIEAYHECLPDWPRVEIINDERKKAAQRAWKFTEESNTIEFWKGMFLECKGNAFMEGDNDRGWKGNFDYLLTNKAMVKIYEGNQPK